MPFLPLKCYELKNVPPIIIFVVFTFKFTFESFKEFGGVSQVVVNYIFLEG
jgi:hypothetical protein